jgi:hypothetical protein
LIICKILKLILWLKSQQSQLLKLHLPRIPKRKEEKLNRRLKKPQKLNSREPLDLKTPQEMSSPSAISWPPGMIPSSTSLISPVAKP